MEEKEEKKEKVEKKEKKKEIVELREGFGKLLQDGEKWSLNKLNQDAKAKKILKPLLKKAEIKQLNKKSLESIVDYRYHIFEENNIVHVQLRR